MSHKESLIVVMCCAIILCCIIVATYVVDLHNSVSDEDWTRNILQSREVNVHIRTYGMDYDRDFHDLQDKQVCIAQVLGITPCATRAEVSRYKKQLTLVEDCDTYIVRRLTHSSPYLIPKAKKLLDKIGSNFQDSLSNIGAPLYKLEVTSILRTNEDVKNLSVGNVNASKNSVHCYGTTFDISWSNFEKANCRDPHTMNEDNLKKILGRVLFDLRKEGWCYVKYEKKQACFHITVRK